MQNDRLRTDLRAPTMHFVPEICANGKTNDTLVLTRWHRARDLRTRRQRGPSS
jgi:hypothetical protein